MKIYKEKQYLIFEYEDGRLCKYDFATKTAYGFSGKKVKDLKTQLGVLSIDTLCESCTDQNYGRFLRFVARHGSLRGRYPLENIGTILSRIPKFSRYEQIFSAGVDDIVSLGFSYTINDIPRGLIKLCKDHRIRLSNDFLDAYKVCPDAHQIAYKLEYMSLSDDDVFKVLTEGRYIYNIGHATYFNDLIKKYGYNAKSLMKYIDRIKTLEAVEDVRYLVRELYDYAKMMSEISPKLDRYPRNFLTTIKIASRNYNRLKVVYKEEAFASRIDLSLEKTFGDYIFVYPKSTQDIKDEAVQQNNCVSSYISDVINGHCHILFLRRKEEPEKSLVTVEVRNGQICQALQRFNYPLTYEQDYIVKKWNEWHAKVMEENERLENAS